MQLCRAQRGRHERGLKKFFFFFREESSLFFVDLFFRVVGTLFLGDLFFGGVLGQLDACYLDLKSKSLQRPVTLIKTASGMGKAMREGTEERLGLKTLLVGGAFHREQNHC